MNGECLAATCAPHVSPRMARRGPQHCTSRAPPPLPMRSVSAHTTRHMRHRLTRSEARRCKHTQMQLGGAARSSCPPEPATAPSVHGVEPLLQPRRQPSCASPKPSRRRSASSWARPARDSIPATAARESARLGAPCDPRRPRRFPRVGTPQRRPLAPSQQRPRPPQLVETGEGSGPFERLHKLTRGRFATMGSTSHM